MGFSGTQKFELGNEKSKYVTKRSEIGNSIKNSKKSKYCTLGICDKSPQKIRKHEQFINLKECDNLQGLEKSFKRALVKDSRLFRLNYFETFHTFRGVLF